MLDNIELEHSIRMAVFELMLTMYHQGITEIHVGGLMRILGVDNDTASNHDDERLVLDQEFTKYVEQIKTVKRPADQPLH